MTGVLFALVLATGSVAAVPEAPTPEATSTNGTETVVIRTARLRNPFWPVGYDEGDYEAISDGSEAAESAMMAAAVEAEAAERKARRSGVAMEDDPQTQERRWRLASRQVKVNGVTSIFSDGGAKSVICINGRSYARGDRLAVDHDGCRFIWKVEDFDDVGYVKLVRVRYRSLQVRQTTEDESL